MKQKPRSPKQRKRPKTHLRLPDLEFSTIICFGFTSSSGQSGFWTARKFSYRRSATFCVHEATLR